MKIGDVVQLKSGGSLMTIAGTGQQNYDEPIYCQNKFYCVWLDIKNRPQYYYYPEIALRLVSEM